VKVYCSDCEKTYVFDFSVVVDMTPHITKDYYICKGCGKTIFVFVDSDGTILGEEN